MENAINNINQSVTSVQNIQVKEPESRAKDTTIAVNQQETVYDAVSSQGDTLSISQIGKAANSGDGVVLPEKSNADGIVLQKESGADDAEADSESTINLSTYTKTELKQMYLNGDITKIEYDDELRDRGVDTSEA